VDCCGASYTGNMRECLLATGLFRWVPIDKQPYAQRGDIYLSEANHTAMCTSDEPDMLCQFSISENGTIYGQQGDQTGRESLIKPYYNFPWDGILAYNHKADEEDDMPTADEIAKAVWKKDVNGMSAGERLYLDNKQLFDRKDYSGRGKDGSTPIERITWIGAKLDKVLDKLDEIEKRLDDGEEEN